MSDKYRIAFVMGGGVSLGAFSAGALAQALTSLERSREMGQIDCVVDVFSGASAGSITLTMAAHELFNGEDPGDALRDLWVDALDVDRLYAEDLDHHHEPALFASKLLRDRLELLVDDEKRGTGHPLLGDRVAMGFTLTNLNGVRFEAPLAWADDLPDSLEDAAATTLFNDQRRFSFVNEGEVGDELITDDEGRKVRPDDRDAWRLVADSAVTSGAFPGAFIPRVIARHADEYGHTWSLDEDEKLWTYADGGIFNNEPLKMAIEMARHIDESDPDPDAKRVFIVIDPNLSSAGTHDPDFFVNDDLRTAGPSGVTDVLKRVATAVSAQASAKDWLKAGKRNNQVRWLRFAVKQLAAVMSSLPGDFDSAALTDAIDVQLADIIKTKYQATSGLALEDTQRVRDYRASQKVRIRDDYGEALQVVEDPAHRELLVALVALLENVSGLRKKRELTMLGIAPDNEHPAAGGFLGNFGGFFEEPLRAHDYQLGRATADRILSESGVMPVISDASADPPDRVGGGYGGLSETVQDRFEAYLGEFGLKLLNAPEIWGAQTAAEFVARLLVEWAGRESGASTDDG